MSAVPKNAVIDPNTGLPVTAAQALAAWLEKNEPQLFAALAQAAASSGAPASSGLGDWSDILSSIGSGAESVASDIGSGLSSAASSVGSWLTSSSGLSSLSSLANTYLQTQQAQSLTQLQIARAQAGQAPAPVTYTTNSAGQVVPVYTGTLPATVQAAGAVTPVTLSNGQTGYALNPNQVAALTAGGSLSAFFSQYGMPLALLGGGLLLVALLMRR